MMVYRFCVSSDAKGDDPYAAFENSLIYAAYLLERLGERARANGAELPIHLNTPYINTIRPEDEADPIALKHVLASRR